MEALEEGYAGTALRTADLSSYYRAAEDYLDRCGARKPIASARAEEEPERPSKTGKSSTNNTNRKTSGGTKRAANGSRNSGAKRAANGSRNGGTKRTATRAEARQRQKRLNRKVVLVLLALLVIGLLLRGFAMNWQ